MNQVFLMGLRTLLVSTAVMLLVAPNQPGQRIPPSLVQRLLPPEAKVIEVANVNTSKGNTRTLALWMLHPKKVMRQGELGCSEFLYGDHWYGPTRLSLVDLANSKVINTVEIRGLYEGSDDDEHGFPIPFHVSREYYAVLRPDKSGEGLPKILDLQDLTGEGVIGQFVLFEYEACGIALTTVLGYSRSVDAAVQYRVEISEKGENTEIVSWIPHLFTEKPVRPGYWDISWGPGHGCFCTVHEQVSFGPTRQIFVENRKVTPEPDAAKQMGKKKR